MNSVSSLFATWFSMFQVHGGAAFSAAIAEWDSPAFSNEKFESLPIPLVQLTIHFETDRQVSVDRSQASLPQLQDQSCSTVSHRVDEACSRAFSSDSERRRRRCWAESLTVRAIGIASNRLCLRFLWESWFFFMDRNVWISRSGTLVGSSFAS